MATVASLFGPSAEEIVFARKKEEEDAARQKYLARLQGAGQGLGPFAWAARAGVDVGETLRTAIKLEGSVRNTGIHACGVIITPSDIREHVPVATAKDSDMWCTQFDNSVVENAGLLKMDFLGLKTLTLIKTLTLLWLICSLYLKIKQTQMLGFLGPLWQRQT